jgi:hypothetical protein
LTGGELVIVNVPGRPNVFDTYQVKGDAPDATPDYLPNKLQQAGAVQVTTVGSPANTKAQINVPFATVAPPASAGAGAVGVSTKVAKEDHQHPAPATDPPLGTLTPLVESGAGSVGVSTSCSREDHVHPAGGGGGTPGSLLYEEQSLPAAGGPNHTITLATGTYPLGVNALIVNVGGIEWPASLITEISPTQFTINGWGLGNNAKVIARVPLGAPTSGMVTNLYEIQAAAPAQLLFNLATGSYVVGSKSLHILVNGVLVKNDNTYYVETSPTSVTFLNVAPWIFTGGEQVLFVVFQGAATPAYTPANGANWTDPDPTNMGDALDRIAAALVAHTGVPIP